MARALGHVIFLLRLRQLLGERQRGLGLAEAADIVILALDGEQRGLGDGAGIDQATAVQPFALGQGMALKHDLDGLQVEFGGHVADRAIFLVEILAGAGAFLIALHQMLEHLIMAVEVAAEVHRHEASQLQEAGIHLAPRAGIQAGHGGDHILREPGMGPFGGKRVDRSRCLPRVDRPAHQGERARHAGVLVLRHEGGGGVAGHRGLTDREHVRARADLFQKLDDIVDIIVQIEAARFHGHILRVAPVGDIDVMAGQHALHRAAQKRREMAGHRRHDQEARLALNAFLNEVLELTEGFARRDLFLHDHGLAVDFDRFDAESRLAARAGSMREHIERRGDDRAGPHIAERIQRVGEQICAHVRKHAGTGQK